MALFFGFFFLYFFYFSFFENVLSQSTKYRNDRYVGTRSISAATTYSYGGIDDKDNSGTLECVFLFTPSPKLRLSVLFFCRVPTMLNTGANVCSIVLMCFASCFFRLSSVLIALRLTCPVTITMVQPRRGVSFFCYSGTQCTTWLQQRTDTHTYSISHSIT